MNLIDYTKSFGEHIMHAIGGTDNLVYTPTTKNGFYHDDVNIVKHLLNEYESRSKKKNPNYISKNKSFLHFYGKQKDSYGRPHEGIAEFKDYKSYRELYRDILNGSRDLFGLIGYTDESNLNLDPNSKKEIKELIKKQAKRDTIKKSALIGAGAIGVTGLTTLGIKLYQHRHKKNQIIKELIKKGLTPGTPEFEKELKLKLKRVLLHPSKH